VARRNDVRGWTETIFSPSSAPEAAQAAQRDIYAYLTELVADKRLHSADDLTAALVNARDNDDALSEKELADSLFLFLFAGHETTVHLLGHAIINLLEHREQLDRALAEGLWGDVVEETMRHNPPVTNAVFRYSLRDVEIAGVTIPQGDAILVSNEGSALDYDFYGPDAASFNIARKEKRHLAFGHGVHMCLGAPLARLEGTVGLSTLFGKLPDLKEAINLTEISYSPSIVTHGPLSIPVFTGRPARDHVDVHPASER
jgi:cytochrome P450